MSKRAPSTTQLLVITGFALSCFGILLFLWVTFGGPTPFRAKTYEVKVPFNEATQLAEQSDVRISGVNVGKVQKIELAPNGEQALATVAIDAQYAPIPESTRAILRTKTLLGETYIELTPGSREGRELADGGTLPEANIAESVQLDEIFRTFNAETRAAFQEWMQEAAVAIQGQGQSLSYALGGLEPTFTEFDRLFRVLDSQRLAVGQLFSNGATTFRALRGREGELADLVQSSNAVFQGLGPVIKRAPSGFAATRKLFRDEFPPLLRAVDPFLRNLNPILVGLKLYRVDLSGFFGNVAATFNGILTPEGEAEPVHYLRALGPMTPETIATYPSRLAINRSSAYSPPGWAEGLAEGLPSFDASQCATGIVATLDPNSWEDPSFKERAVASEGSTTTPPKSQDENAKLLFERIQQYAFNGQTSTSSIGAPPCKQQAPFKPIYGDGPSTQYQHTFEQQTP
jgi:phospholipid/cholesterol/gamma-HCH transport system substrate-binding protein